MSDSSLAAWRSIRRLLVVRLDNMGDVILLSPALRALKMAIPDLQITLLASPAGQQSAVLLPWIDDVIVWRATWQDVGGRLPFDPWRERILIAELASREFDAAIIFTSFSQNAHVPGYVCYLAGIPLRAGMVKEFGGSVLTVEIRHEPDCQHQAERNIRLIEHLGFSVTERRLMLAIPPAGYQEAEAVLAQYNVSPSSTYILVHPGASCQARRCPPQLLAKVVGALAEHGLPVFVTGVEREHALVAEVVACASSNVYAVVGQLSLPGFAALIARAAIVVCGNTLPLHLADAFGTPVVVLYSGTDLETQWAPRFAPHRLLRRPTACYPCYRFDCVFGDPPCCLDMMPEDVVAAVLDLLQGIRSAPEQAQGWKQA